MYRRRKFRAQADVFELSLRAQGDEKWPRQPAFGRCIRGIIVVNEGLTLLRTTFHEVDQVADLTLDQPPRKPANAVGRLLTLSDGSLLEVAVAPDDASRFDVLTTQLISQPAPRRQLRPTQPLTPNLEQKTPVPQRRIEDAHSNGGTSRGDRSSVAVWWPSRLPVSTCTFRGLTSGSRPCPGWLVRVAEQHRWGVVPRALIH